ncbi:helix-turn-helix domain-containing protein [Parabacteroides sp.]|uniref:AraC family transcriptional regulator n=1 Tax=Parabacteroides sp. TaxID=1869337 RepID=UPI0026E05C4D|nr:helix-turn-helix domain-containing protein [Parabacteroides sp.]MDO5427654.1 helix-turn-helix domain-containing protein [Parabacteroides sp.]
MSYHEFILVVNFSSIIILVLLAMLLLIATRFRGESGYAAAIIVLPNIPVYIYNMSRMLGWHDITLFFFPISYSVNTLLMPLLWLFTRRNFDLDPRFKPVQLLHFLPAIVCVVIVLSIPMRKRMESILHEVTGDDTWIGDFNAAVITSQMIGYFVAIFIYLYRKKQYIKDNWSDAEYMQKEWIPKLMILFAALFVTVMTCYAIWPRTDAWLIQILNVMAMSFLVYNFIAHPTVPYIQGTSRMLVKDETVGFQSIPDEEQMRDICSQVKEYLETTNAFLRKDLSLSILSRETGISQKLLSRSINGYLKQNFFELINEMRVGEAKRRLLLPENAGHTVDSLYEECGFRTRSTFFLAFKKVEGLSPAQWLNSVKKHTDQ